MSQLCEPWVTADDVIACCSKLDSNNSDHATIAANAAAVASESLFDATCGLYPGDCPVTLSACTASCGCGDGCASEACPLPQVTFMALPWPILTDPAPVLTVTDADGNDTVYTSGVDFRIDGGHRMVMLSGTSVPSGTFAAPAGAPSTWKLDATLGGGPTAGLLEATKLWACELAKLCLGEECQVLDNVRTVRHGNTSYGLVSTVDLQRDERGRMLTGVGGVDQLLAGKNLCAKGAAFIDPSDPWGVRG